MNELPSPRALPIVAGLAYSRAGFRVVPLYGVTAAHACTCPRERCDSPGKHPWLSAWQRASSADPSTVREWFRRRPSSNVGLAMGGPRRLVALDVDGAAGRASLAELELELGPLPVTLTSRSGRVDGGEHRILMLPAGVDLATVKNRAGKLGAGLDVRAEGGQIAVAPSLHASGGRYAWTVTVEPAELPAAWAERLASGGYKAVREGVEPSPESGSAPQRAHDGSPLRVGPLPSARRQREHSTGPIRYAQAVLNQACAVLVQTPRGSRNDTAAREAFAVGGLAWTGAYSEADALAAMRAAMLAGDWNRTAVDSLHLATVRRQLSAGAARPRAIPPLSEAP